MCALCDQKNGKLESCQDCGRLICFDETRSNVYVIDKAYVTASGDLFCFRCGKQHDEEEEAAADSWFDDYQEMP